jgi:HEAT repeat protein
VRNRKPLLEVLQTGELPARLAALDVLGTLWNDDVQQTCCTLLADPEPEVRRRAAESLALHGPPGDASIHEALLHNFDEKDPQVRKAIYLAMGHIGAAGAADCLVNIFRSEEAKDAATRDGLLRAIERLGKPGIDKLLEVAESGVDQDRDRVLEAFAALRSRPAAEAIPYLLKSPHVNVRQRTELLRAYGRYRLTPPLSLEPVADYLLKHPEEPAQVKRAGVEVLAAALPAQETSSLNAKRHQLLLKLLEDNQAELRLAVIGAIEKAKLTEAAPRLRILLEDTSRSAAERAAVKRALGVLGREK